MEGNPESLINFFKALFALTVMGVGLAFVSALVAYIFDVKNVREENSHLSTGVGNALMILHSVLEPGRKPQTEQLIKVRRKRTRIEKGIKGLSPLNYDTFSIKGFSHLSGKRYYMLDKETNS